jgi:hypothetical protein
LRGKCQDAILREKGIAQACEPFTMAKLKYFDAKDIDAAKA